MKKLLLLFVLADLFMLAAVFGQDAQATPPPSPNVVRVVGTTCGLFRGGWELWYHGHRAFVYLDPGLGPVNQGLYSPYATSRYVPLCVYPSERETVAAAFEQPTR